MPAPARHAACLALSLGVTLSPCLGAESLRPPMPEGSVPADSDDAAMKRAKALFERGVAAYSAGRYYDAIEIFSETDRLYPNPQLAYNIAKAYDNLGSKSGGLRYYRDYLRRSPEATDRVVVEARVRELEAALAEQGVQQLSVLSDPPDALVLIDDRPVGLTPWTGQTWPGKHRLELRRADYQTESFVTEVEPHKAAEVKVVMHEAEAGSEPEAKRNTKLPPPRARHAGIQWLTWTALATGGAALGTAVAIEAASGDSSSSIRPGTAFFAGLGTAAALAGGVLLYFDVSDRNAHRTEGQVGLKLTRNSWSARYTTRF